MGEFARRRRAARAVLLSPRPLLRSAITAAFATRSDVAVLASVATVAELRVCASGVDIELVLLDLGAEQRPDELLELMQLAAGIVGFDAERDSAAACAFESCGHAAVVYSDDGLDALVAGMARVRERALSRAPGAGPARSALTARQAQTLGLAASGLSNAAIAAALFISVGTVKRHLSDSFEVLGASSRLDAVIRARAGGHLGQALP